tara:strand:- start:3536 stop:4312 length:777 start_codon:yes stop_codon:yes gene_type:complete
MNWFDVLKLQINIPKQKVRINKPKKIEEEESGCREKMKRVLDTWGNGKEDVKSESLKVAETIWDEYFGSVMPNDKITIEDSYITRWESGTGGKPIPKKMKHQGRGGVFDINLSNPHVVDEIVGGAQFEGSDTEALMEGVPESVACKFLELLNTATGKTGEWEQSITDLEGWDLLGFTRYVPDRNRFGFTVITTGVRTQSKHKRLDEDWYEMSYLFELDPWYLQGIEDTEQWSVYDDALLTKLLKEGWQQINSKVRSML